MDQFKKREVQLLNILRHEAGRNTREDSYHAGYLACINDILNIEVEEVDIDVD